MNRPAFAVAGLSLLLATSACGSGTAPGSTGRSAAGDQVAVIAAFYPLQYVAERVGGEHVSVANLTKPGVEPHDLELTPKDIADVSTAKLAIYTAGFQPPVDKAIAEQAKASGYDVSKDADLTLQAAEHDHGEGDSQAEDHAHEGSDPHFWLDPIRYGKVATALAAKLGEVDAAHKADYERNAQAFTAELTDLDGEFTAALSTCTSRDLVTGHAAFGYLAERYKLTQEPIAGLSPDQEPDAKRLADIAAHVKQHKVSTIYTETLVDPAVARTVAAETGAQTAVLDPIEGLSEASAGKNYLEIMRANLATLKKGQSCR